METTRALHLVLLACISLLWFKLSYGQEVFNPMDYEAVGDGEADDAQALMDAWDAACQHPGPAVFLIPKGQTYLAGPATFEGPCVNHTAPKFQLEGTLKALESMKGFYNPAWLEFKRVDKLELSGGGVLDGQGTKAWSGEACNSAGKPCSNRPTTLRLLRAYNSVVANITLLNSKGFQMSIQQSQSVTVQGVKIIAPDNSPNTDGIHLSRTLDAILDDLNIGTGDDCISLGQGVTNLTVTRVYCGPGHGISVGSLGKYPNEEDVMGVHVRNCTLENTDNGLRIKSWGGSPPSKAYNITFEDVIMHNVSNPIIIDQEYCPDHQCKASAPSKVELQYISYKNIRGSSQVPMAVNLLCSKDFPCKNVQLEDINLEYVEGGVGSNANATCANVQGKALGSQEPKPCSQISYASA